MKLKELYEAIGSLVEEHGDEYVFADITADPSEDPMPAIECVFSFDGYVCIGD